MNKHLGDIIGVAIFCATVGFIAYAAERIEIANRRASPACHITITPTDVIVTSAPGTCKITRVR